MTKRVMLILVLLFIVVVGCENVIDDIPNENKQLEPNTIERIGEVENTIDEISKSNDETENKKQDGLDSQTNSEQPTDKQYNPNLIAYFTFDINGDDAIHHFKGDVKGGAEFRDGKLGNALYFDGVDDYVELSEEALNTLGKLKQGTIAFWLHFDSILNQQAVMPIFYMGIEDKPTNQDNMFVIEIGHAAGTEDFSQRGFPPGTPDPENKKIYATWIKDGQEPFLCSDSEVNIVDNQWQHFAVVSGEDGNILYLNGEEVRNRDYNFGHSTDKAFLEDIPIKEIMTIGYGRSHTWISPNFVYFKGLIDDFRVYDRPLTAEEINDVYAISE